MSFREIKPTKTNLMALKKRVKFAERGENFLEFKREQLIHQIRNYWSKYRSDRSEMLHFYRKSMYELNQVFKEMGKRNVDLVGKVSNLQHNPQIDIKYRKEAGILVPDMDYSLFKEHLPAYGFDRTSHNLETLIDYSKEFFEKIINFAVIEDKILKLGISYSKINRRINGLKNIIIPRLNSDIKKIGEILEENQRESFVRLKKTKDLIEKKQKVY